MSLGRGKEEDVNDFLDSDSNVRKVLIIVIKRYNFNKDKKQCHFEH